MQSLENCSRSVTRTGCRRTGTTSPASLWCEIYLLKIVFFLYYFQLLACQQFLRLVETSKRSYDDPRWDPENERSPTLFPPGCNFPQVDAFVYENCSHNVDTFSEFCTGQNWRPVLRLKLLNLSWWRPMPIIRENLVFTFLGQRLNHPWNIVCRKFILSCTRGFLFCSGQISITFLQDKADRTFEGAKFLTTYEMHYQMNGDSFSFIKGRCNIHIHE